MRVSVLVLRVPDIGHKHQGGGVPQNLDAAPRQLQVVNARAALQALLLQRFQLLG